jgi:hypothetical protein
MNQSVITFASVAARNAAIPAPLEGQLVWLEDSNKYVYYSGSAWVDLIVPASSGNAIINGAFDIWQRGTSFTTAGVYTADRWTYAGGTSNTLTQQTFTPGAAPVAGYEGTFFARYTVTTAGDWNISQPIENVRSFAGETVTLSFWTRTSAASAIQNSYLIQDFGSGGSSIVVTTLAGASTTTGWTRITATATLPSISGKTVGTNSKLTVRIDIAEAFTGTWDIWGVQLESGSSATPFKRNANSIQGELAACQRYFQKSYSQSVAPGTGSSYPGAVLGTGILNIDAGQYFQFVSLRTMRAAPSVTTFSPQSGATGRGASVGGSDFAANSVEVISPVDSGFQIRNGSGATISTGASFIAFHYTASAEL